MTNHWQLLELPPDADERSIKRAYARLLKTHRPDENADNFQRLREAYEASLAEARWRAEGEAEEPVNNLTRDCSPVQASAAEWSHVQPAVVQANTSVASPPTPSLDQMQQWLADGQDRRVLEGLRHWLASDWLLPLERRQQFDRSVFDWLEAAEGWSPAFFDAVCQMMQWDDTHGDLPVEPWRWRGMIRRCEVQAMADSLRLELESYNGDTAAGRAATLLLKPLTDCQRRLLADRCTPQDWQRFTELAKSIEYHPELPGLLGLEPLKTWRNWLPAGNYWELRVFLWAALTSVLVLGSLMQAGLRTDLLSVAILSSMTFGAIIFGQKAYNVWASAAMGSASMDIAVSQRLIPARWYRGGAGLLVFRHVIPSVVPALLLYLMSGSWLGLKVINALVAYLGTLYLTDMALCGKVSVLGRGRLIIEKQLQRLPWHWLRRDALLGIAAVVGAAAAMYLSVRG